MPVVQLSLGELLFQFNSMQAWVNQAQRIWKIHRVRSEDTICVDSVGRIVTKGAEFMRADRESTYPIFVYRKLTDDPLPRALPDGWMPILGTCLGIPTKLLNEQQAKANHNQSLTMLRERGGISLDEALAIAEKRKWRSIDGQKSLSTLTNMLAAVQQQWPSWYGADTPWPLHDVLIALAEATQHLLDDHNCDRHGHEVWRLCEKRATEIVALIKNSRAPASKNAAQQGAAQ
ncbi:hypothetical protein [Pseudohongiella sp. O18]|uniref:hypothetical protein n=1 Tax=Pseudohongiella sp. O18 TaxID=2904248 RepID=UPI001F19AEC7|nr:hypothetical protein [Pseudohongiella sp. O18]